MTNELFNIPSNCGSIESEVQPIVESKVEEWRSFMNASCELFRSRISLCRDSYIPQMMSSWGSSDLGFLPIRFCPPFSSRKLSSTRKSNKQIPALVQAETARNRFEEINARDGNRSIRACSRLATQRLVLDSEYLKRKSFGGWVVVE